MALMKATVMVVLLLQNSCGSSSSSRRSSRSGRSQKEPVAAIVLAAERTATRTLEPGQVISTCKQPLLRLFCRSCPAAGARFSAGGAEDGERESGGVV